MKPTKLSPSQLKMKALLKPIVEGILKEAEIPQTPAQQDFINTFDRVIQDLTISYREFTAKNGYGKNDLRMFSNFLEKTVNNLKSKVDVWKNE